MADTDLLFKIQAVDEYKQQLNDAITLVDKMSATEREALKATTDKAKADQQAAGIIVDRIKAIHETTDSTQQLTQTEHSATDSTQKQTEAEKGLADQTQQVGQQNRSVIGSFTELNSALQLGQMALSKFKEAWDFAKEGAAIERIGAQFDQVAADFGINGDKLVEAMDRAAHGTVDDEELMQTATRALTQGVITNANDLTKFVDIARASAVRFGGDTTQALQSILYATEVGAQRQLKATLGVVDFSKAYDDLAARLGKRKQDLTDEEQLQARVNAVLAKGDELVAKVGTTGDDAATKMQRFETRMKELGDQLHVTFADILLPALDRGDAFTTVLDQNVSASDRLAAALKLQADPLSNMHSQITAILPQLQKAAEQEADLKNKVYAASTGLYGQAGALDESTRATRTATDAHENYARQLAAAQKNAYLLEDATDRVARRTKEYTVAIKAQGESLSSEYMLAVTYTKAEENRAEVEQKLSDLNAKIASQGIAHSVVVANQRMTEEQRAVTLQKLAVAQENVTQIQRGASETDAEYNLRLTEARGKVDDLSKALGTHTGVVGGATKAQLEQKQALEDQIAAFQKASEIQRATEIFNAVAQAIKAGTLSADEGADRLDRLNRVSHLYSDTALEEAKNQLALLAAFTDPKSEAWYALLLKSQDALDGVSKATQTVTTKDLSALQSASSDMTRTAQKGIEDVQTQVSTSGGQMRAASEVALGKIKDVEVGISTSASAAAAVAKGDVEQIGKAATALTEHDYIIKFRIITEGEMPTPSSSSRNVPARQMGGAIDETGLYLLHKDEYVLSAAMRTGRQPIPARALPPEMISPKAPAQKSDAARIMAAQTILQSTIAQLAAPLSEAQRKQTAPATAQTGAEATAVIEPAAMTAISPSKLITSQIGASLAGTRAPTIADRREVPFVVPIPELTSFKAPAPKIAEPQGIPQHLIPSEAITQLMTSPKFAAQDALQSTLLQPMIAMSARMQSLPAQPPVSQLPPTERGGQTTINNNNFYDGLSTKLWLEQQRLESLQSVLEAM